MLNELRKFDPGRADMEELLSLNAFGKALRAEHELHGVPVPEWLDDKLRVLAREIAGRRRDALELRLKEARAEEQRLQTPTERRARLQQDIAALEEQLKTA